MVVGVGERGFDRLERAGQDIPEQEQQDADRDSVEECLEREGRVADAPDGESQEDGEPGNGAKDQDFAVGHVWAPRSGVGRWRILR